MWLRWGKAGGDYARCIRCRVRHPRVCSEGVNLVERVAEEGIRIVLRLSHWFRGARRAGRSAAAASAPVPLKGGPASPMPRTSTSEDWLPVTAPRDGDDALAELRSRVAEIEGRMQSLEDDVRRLIGLACDPAGARRLVQARLVEEEV